MIWYKSVFLVTSNVALLPTIALAFWFGFLADAGVFIVTFVTSTLYHCCHAEWFCIGPLEYLQLMDHGAVWSNIFWIYLTFLDIERNAMFFIYLITTMLFHLFSFILVDTFLFPLVLAPACLGIFVIHVFFWKIPIAKYDILLTLVGLSIFGVGLGFQLSSKTLFEPNYWWKHGIWHWLSMGSSLFIYLVRLGLSTYLILEWFGVTSYFLVLKDDLVLRISRLMDGRKDQSKVV